MKYTLLYVGSNGEKHLKTLFGRRNTLSWIHPDAISGLATSNLLPWPRQVYNANEESYVEVISATVLDFYINGVLLSDEFLIVPGLDEEVVIGEATLRKWRIKLDFEHEQLHVDPRVAKLQLYYQLYSL